MINVGINGFGRIGKCVFLQLLEDKNIQICAINALDVNIDNIQSYLKYDCTHSYSKNFDYLKIDENTFQINGSIIHLASERRAKNINWREYGCNIVIEATGAYLTSEKCLDHSVDHVIISAPPKDNTPTFVYGANHNNYTNESIISAASCTTNCLAPALKLLDDSFGVKHCSFTTIHATTASQMLVDSVPRDSNRTHRSVFNNIIPHSTGASSAIGAVLPTMAKKVSGTSVRVPVTCGSYIDLTIKLEDKNANLTDIECAIRTNPLFGTVFEITKEPVVSSDFLTTITPTIFDLGASMCLGNGRFKLMIWYDNEWSYSAQLIKLFKHVFTSKKNNYCMKNIEFIDKRVVCRVDYNVPVDHNNRVVDDKRIRRTESTLQYILSKEPHYLIIATHFGRPCIDDSDEFTCQKYSTRFLIPHIEKMIGSEYKVEFLADGITQNSIDVLGSCEKGTVFLLENLRFHPEETFYDTMSDTEHNLNTTISAYSQMGNVFINDAFGCSHRNHMSISAPKLFVKNNALVKHGFGNLVTNEIEKISPIISCCMKSTGIIQNKRILFIVGGNKIVDKIGLIDVFKTVPNASVFVGGGLVKKYLEQHQENIRNGSCNMNDQCVTVAVDGYGNDTLAAGNNPIYIPYIHTNEVYNAYDLGYKSLIILKDMCNKADIIFWNGALGVIESDLYRKGSVIMLDYLSLLALDGKTVIIGGGETGSLVDDSEKNIYVSTGGGALMEYVQNKIVFGKSIVGIRELG